MTNSTQISVLSAQFPVSLSIRQNLETILGMLDHAQPGDMVVFPEGSVSGYSHDLSFLDEINQQELQAALERLRGEARKRGIHLWAGSCTLAGNRWFNSAFGFTPEGETHIYRKINLATHERGVLTPGVDLPVFLLATSEGLVTVGIQICREIRYPEQWGWLARQGAQVILHLNNAVGDDSYQLVWRSHLVSRAAETQRFVVSVNNAAPQQVSPTIVVAPDGQVLAEVVSAGCEFFRVGLDLSRVSNWYLDQCRPDVVAIEAPKEDERRRIVKSMDIAKIQIDFKELQNNPTLFEDANFNART
ncbi:MAG: carbon-nitrogen hydrolase family protein, partial [Chloroflexi bacterium]|nr:carbon-nitrogen hydrolase family protein [Chloroflexota bacterium]